MLLILVMGEDRKWNAQKTIMVLFLVINQSEVKYVTNYSNDELVTKSSAVSDWWT